MSACAHDTPAMLPPTITALGFFFRVISLPQALDSPLCFYSLCFWWIEKCFAINLRTEIKEKDNQVQKKIE